MPNAPLGMPIGSVRAILAILVVIACIIAGWVNKAPLFDLFKDLTLIVMTFYFTSRMMDKKNNTPMS